MNLSSSPSVTCSPSPQGYPHPPPSTVPTPIWVWSNHVFVLSAPVSCPCHLIPVTCCSVSQRPLCLPPGSVLFSCSLLIPGSIPLPSEGGVLQCEGGPGADSGNIVKYLTSLILQQIPNIDEILTQTTLLLLLLLLLLPSRLNTVQSKPVKNRKCLSSAEPPPFLWQRNCRVVSRLHPVCNIFDNLDSRHQRGLGLI